MAKSIYIAGPMRGYSLWNFPAFDTANKYLSLVAPDSEIISPADMDREAGNVPEDLPEDHDWSQMPECLDLPTVIQKDLSKVQECDSIYMLKGWEKSEGAKAEHAVAVWAGKEIVYEKHQNTVVIGLNGYATAGKDEVADHLVRKYGFTKYSFSNPLMESLLKINPFIFTADSGHIRIEELVARVGWTEAKKNTDVRSYLQKLGTEGGREVHGEDCWVDLMERNWDTSHTPYEPRQIVICNVRFPNEESLVREYGGVVIGINRKDTGPALNHKSDTQDIRVDETISNFFTLQDLYYSVDMLMEDRKFKARFQSPVFSKN